MVEQRRHYHPMLDGYPGREEAEEALDELARTGSVGSVASLVDGQATLRFLRGVDKVRNALREPERAGKVTNNGTR